MIANVTYLKISKRAFEAILTSALRDWIKSSKTSVSIGGCLAKFPGTP
jgi:hypothetical protein